MTQAALIRPAWTPITIAMMVIGFMIFWPLGLAMIAYILWGDQLEGFKTDINRATEGMSRSFSRNCGPRSRRHNRHSHARTGNVAFDDWREVELARLDEERAKLNEMRHEFDEYSRDLRRAKDQAEFDGFMNSKKPPKTVSPKSVPKT